jgi:hypothetical protein
MIFEGIFSSAALFTVFISSSLPVGVTLYLFTFSASLGGGGGGTSCSFDASLPALDTWLVPFF